jgi:hypothetical protein
MDEGMEWSSGGEYSAVDWTLIRHIQVIEGGNEYKDGRTEDNRDCKGHRAKGTISYRRDIGDLALEGIF